MCVEEVGSEIQGGWRRGKGSWNQGMFRGIGKRSGSAKENGALVDEKSFV